MRIGLYVSAAAAGSFGALLDAFGRAEEAGFHTAWLGQVFDVDALTVLALAGHGTRRIELGSWVVPSSPRHPAALAQQALTAQAACGGRLVLGLGASHAAVVERRFGLSYARPLSQLRETLDVLLPLLARGEVDHAGPRARARLSLERAHPDAPPVLLGALGPRMLELAGARCAGAALWLAGPRALERHAVPRLRAAARAAGRPAPRLAVGLPIALTRRTDARASVDAFLGSSARLPAYRRILEREGAASPADVAILGDEDELARRLAALRDLGVTDFNAVCVPVPGDAGAPARTRRWLAEQARAAAR